MTRLAFAASLALFAASAPSSARAVAPGAPPTASGFPLQVAGSVTDLALDAAGRILYCTLERDVGRIETDGTASVLASAADGFPSLLHAVVETPGGDVAVIDDFGDIYVLLGGLPPAVTRYTDAYMIAKPTDMAVDVNGNFVIASATPSNMKQGINWVSGDGQRWAYYKVRHQPLARPIQLAADPVDGSLLVADQEFGGLLQTIDPEDPTRPFCVLDGTTLYGFTAAADDGDMAVEANGDVLVISGGTVRRHERASGTVSTLASGFGQLTGIVIAASSGCVASPSGWSAYVSEGAAPTTIREIPDVGAPASSVLPALGTVPNQGQFVKFYGVIRAYEIETDLDGNLLIGGDLFGSSRSVRRLDLDTLQISVVAGESDGITGRIEGIVQQPNGTIWAMDNTGKIYRIQENPKSVTVHYDDDAAQNQVVYGKDLAYDRDGNLYVADREAWMFGEVRTVHPDGTTEKLVGTIETRGITADPDGPGYFLTEWVNTGFVSKVSRYDFETDTKADLPGFQGFNLTNANSWGDGDGVLDVEGFLYVAAEDDWTVVRWKPGRSGIERIGSMYLNHPSGLAIAPSRAPSSTGWSLYVSEYDMLHEIPDVAPPAPEIIDPTGPDRGNLFGYLDPRSGTPADVVASPAGLAGRGVLLPTSKARLVHLAEDGVASEVAGPAQGLAGELRAAEVRPDGHVLVASAEGVVYELDPAAGWSASVLFADPDDALEDVSDLALDGLGRPLLLDRPAGRPTSRLFVVEDGAAELVAFTNRGARLAADPLTAEVFVTQEGHPSEPGGELLRVDLEGVPAAPAAVGAWRGASYTQLDVWADGGGLAFDDAGDVYVAEDGSGRVARLDRASGTRADVGGNYGRPRAVALGPGRPEHAGAAGTSLFVLDGWTVYELGVEGAPAPAPPAADPGLAPPADLLVRGLARPGGELSLSLSSAPDAGKLYVVFPSLSGHLPGLPLRLLRDPSDPRVLASNPDFLWDQIGSPSFPGFTGVLDPAGGNPAGTAIRIPDVLEVMNDSWLDLTWAVIDGSARNYMAYVGGNAHVFLGQ